MKKSEACLQSDTMLIVWNKTLDMFVQTIYVCWDGEHWLIMLPSEY